MVARDWAGQWGGEAERSPVKSQKTLSGKNHVRSFFSTVVLTIG